MKGTNKFSSQQDENERNNTHVVGVLKNRLKMSAILESGTETRKACSNSIMFTICYP